MTENSDELTNGAQALKPETTTTTTMTPVDIAAFYHFQQITASQVPDLARVLEKKGKEFGLRGLVIFGAEGLNATVSGPRTAIDSYLLWLSETLGFPTLSPKYSQAPRWPFHRFKVRVRKEIVTLGKPEVLPLGPGSPTHLTPDEWDKMMAEDDVIVIDTRNWYETRIGKMRGAIDPQIAEFNDFPKFIEAGLDSGAVQTDKKVLLYCTGGIRCEKAIVEMRNQGFDKVYQLDGGILNYLKQKPNTNFEGECFVFDHRVAVTQDLTPTAQYKLCPHCGQPAEHKLNCLRCDDETVICVSCQKLGDAYQTCSKNCAYHYRLRPGARGLPQRLGARFGEK